MAVVTLRSENFLEGYRISSNGATLRIETIRSDARPLILNRVQLAQFGLKFKEAWWRPQEQVDQR